jgi:hypothetical protein
MRVLILSMAAGVLVANYQVLTMPVMRTNHSCRSPHEFINARMDALSNIPWPGQIVLALNSTEVLSALTLASSGGGCNETQELPENWIGASTVDSKLDSKASRSACD